MPPRGYRHLSIREEVYRKLEEFAKSKGLAYPADAIPLLLEYADIYSKLEYLLQVRVKDLLQTGAVTRLESITSTSDNVTTSTGNVTTSSGNVDQPKPSTNPGGGYEWCRPRSSIKNLEGFVNYLERSLGPEDWWEEDDRVCFKTAKRPAKI